MRCSTLLLASALLTLGTTSNATTFTFDSDPFAGTTALTTPGRQIVANEQFISFNPGTDVFAFDPAVFGVANQIHFVNGAAGNLPSGGVNVVVLESFDDDNNPLTPFGAGNAASLIAQRISTPGAGFFVYFNQALNVPRLVFSTDLDDPTADLKVLARMTNLTGQDGRDALPEFTAANFATIASTAEAAAPEPATLLLMAAGAFGFVGIRRRIIATATS